jgi:hypothetical protein
MKYVAVSLVILIILACAVAYSIEDNYCHSLDTVAPMEINENEYFKNSGSTLCTVNTYFALPAILFKIYIIDRLI